MRVQVIGLNTEDELSDACAKLDDALPWRKEVGGATYVLRWRKDKLAWLLHLKMDAKQILRLGTEASKHPKAEEWMINVFLRLGADVRPEDLSEMKAEFLKDS